MVGQPRYAVIRKAFRGLAVRRPGRLAGLLGLTAAGLAAWAAVSMSIRPAAVLYLLYVIITLILGIIALTTLVWMLYAWRTPHSFAESRLLRDDREPACTFSLIVPARHEEAVLDVTLERLSRSDHPAFEIIVVVGDDDHATAEVAERAAARHPGRVKVIVDSNYPKMKPKALNTALPHCTGAITGVFDAEDDVHPGLLQRVDQCFQATDADIVQAGVQLMNFHSSWLTVHNVLEYYFWFRSRLHRHARQRFIPLGGNTVFIRTPVLRAVAGWDAECLAEDCELGVRLSSLGARTAVFYEPELVTREECPPTLSSFVRQRTRWCQGYLQTLSRGYWRRLPLPQRALGGYILAMPFAMAIAWLLIPIAIGTAIGLKAPIEITLITFLPALPMACMLVADIAGLGEFCREYRERSSVRDYARLILGLPLYQAVLTFSAARAVARELRGTRGWEKTAHLGLHLAGPADGQLARPGARQPALGGRVAAVTAAREWLRPPAARLQNATAGALDTGPDVVAYALAPSAGSSPPPPGPAVDQVAANPAPPEYLDGWTAGAGGHGHGHGNGQAPVGAGPAGLGAIRRGGLPDGARWAGTARDRLSWVLASRADLVLQLVLLAVIAVVVGVNLVHWPLAQFDEGTYLADAWAVQFGRLAPYTYSYGHPPVGWLLISLWTWAQGLFGHSSYSLATGRGLMLVVDLVSCSLLYVLAGRLGFGRVAAAAAVVLFGLSPLGIFYHRAILLDNPSVAWAIAAFLLAWTPRRRLWAFAGSGACFAVAALCKETTLTLLPALLYAVVQNCDRRTRRYCVPLFLSSFILLGGFYPLYAFLKGELLPGPHHVSLAGYLTVQLFTRKSTGSLFDPYSQTHAIVIAWLHLDPWLLGTALALVPVALARRTTRAITLAFLIQVLTVLRPGYLPNMYVIGMLPFAALMVPGSVEAAGRWARGLPAGFSRAARSVIGALTLLAVVIAVPRWEQADQVAMTVRMDGPDNAAEQWLVSHVNHTARLIVVDQYWIYLIDHGFNHHPERGGFFSRTVVSYWPLDYDPAVKKAFPRGWREFNLVVVTQDMRDTLTQTPTAAAAIAHSRLVAVFGHGLQQVQIRLIAGTRLSTVLRGPPPRPRSTPSPAGPPEPHPGPTVPSYTVQPGDTLSGIASRYRLRGGWSAIYQRNRGIVGRNPNVIYPGEHLTP
jgi:cellulose synthase/poly-beta-1,6-N-acetylglucosamine synthase-like glycosyltransferase/4-amino-4-deoxy-L-arabinose transferase-like glycosyltransferase/LysM repeat protein